MGKSYCVAIRAKSVYWWNENFFQKTLDLSLVEEMKIDIYETPDGNTYFVEAPRPYYARGWDEREIEKWLKKVGAVKVGEKVLKRSF